MFDMGAEHSDLRSVLERLRQKVLQGLSDSELESGFADLEHAAQGLEAERARWLAEIDRRRTYEAGGHLSATSWLVDRFGASGAAASQQVRVARALEEMPMAREALGKAEISTSAVKVLVQAKEEQPQAFAESEALLVQAAKALPVRRLCSTVAEWSRRADERAAEDRARRLKERRRLAEAGSIEAEDARRIACDASITRVLFGGASEPLDLGRRTPIISGALRRAVVIRDGECRVPLCDRPASWCDVHHVRHWADGGETALANLVLLCRPHHRLVHEGAFGMEMIDGRPVFRRPDGSVMEEGRAPP